MVCFSSTISSIIYLGAGSEPRETYETGLRSVSYGRIVLPALLRQHFRPIMLPATCSERPRFRSEHKNTAFLCAEGGFGLVRAQITPLFARRVREAENWKRWLAVCPYTQIWETVSSFHFKELYL